ncbi:MAG TPA: hypothetical protein PKD85_00720 [Saprospiraceae bacterium]|nr:hypothetical protein [Saprospiraceae bacterium]
MKISLLFTIALVLIAAFCLFKKDNMLVDKFSAFPPPHSRPPPFHGGSSPRVPNLCGMGGLKPPIGGKCPSGFVPKNTGYGTCCTPPSYCTSNMDCCSIPDPECPYECMEGKCT